MRKKSFHLIFDGNCISGGAAVRRCDGFKFLKGAASAAALASK
jgi:hypothetical protein